MLQLRLKYLCGGNNAVLSLPLVNQAEWHTVKIKVNVNGAELLLNDEERQTSVVGCKSISLKSPYYVGGANDATFLETIKSDLEVQYQNMYFPVQTFEFGV